MAATHFHDVFLEELLSPSLPISFVHMQVLLTTHTGQILDVSHTESNENEKPMLHPGEPITYLYRYEV
jgi:DNA mismatch repair protein MSH5